MNIKRLLSGFALLALVGLPACTTTAPPPGASAGDPVKAISAVCAEKGADSEVCLLGSSYARGETPDVPAGSRRYRATARACAGLVQSECDKAVAIALEEEVRHWRRPLAEGEFTPGQLRLLSQRFTSAAESCLPDNRSTTAPRATTHAPASSYRPNNEWTVESFNLTGRLATGPVPLERIPPEFGWAIRQAIGCLERVSSSGEFAPLDVAYADALKESGSKPVAIAPPAPMERVPEVALGQAARYVANIDSFRIDGDTLEATSIELRPGVTEVAVDSERDGFLIREHRFYVLTDGLNVRFCKFADRLDDCGATIINPGRAKTIRGDEHTVRVFTNFGSGRAKVTFFDLEGIAVENRSVTIDRNDRDRRRR